MTEILRNSEISYPSMNSNATSTSYEKMFPYNAIFIDEEKKQTLIEILPNATSIPLLSIPNSLSIEELPQFFHDQAIIYNSPDQKPFVISGHPRVVTSAYVSNLDTCFINSGLNDCESYYTTYEVPRIEKVKAIKLKH